MKTANFREALNVSEAILASNSDTAFKWMAMYVKAESLFNMCDFEHAMVFYSRAQEIAPSAVINDNMIVLLINNG